MTPDDAAEITRLGRELVTHTATPGADMVKVTNEFLALRNSHLREIDAVRYAALVFTEIAAAPIADGYVCKCEGPECTGLTIAFGEGDLGSLNMVGPDAVPEPLRTFGRVVGAHITQDVAMLGALIAAVPETAMQEFISYAFQVAVVTTRQSIGAQQ